MSDVEAGLQASWAAKLGRRNLLYLAFLAVWLVLIVLWSNAPGDPIGRGMGTLYGLGFWALVTAPFAIWNLVAFFAAAGRGRPIRVPGIALLLVILCTALGALVLNVAWGVTF